MRPPEFTGGNGPGSARSSSLHPRRFNEAAGIHRRKRSPTQSNDCDSAFASMRPPEFTGGNTPAWIAAATSTRRCFNEAAGIHRRKPTDMAAMRETQDRASMRPPEFTGGNAECSAGENDLTAELLQ